MYPYLPLVGRILEWILSHLSVAFHQIVLFGLWLVGLAIYLGSIIRPWAELAGHEIFFVVTNPLALWLLIAFTFGVVVGRTRGGWKQ